MKLILMFVHRIITFGLHELNYHMHIYTYMECIHEISYHISLQDYRSFTWICILRISYTLTHINTNYVKGLNLHGLNYYIHPYEHQSCARIDIHDLSYYIHSYEHQSYTRVCLHENNYTTYTYKRLAIINTTRLPIMKKVMPTRE